MARRRLTPQILLTLMQGVLAENPFGLLLLDGELRPLWHNREALLACAVWNYGERRGRALRLSTEGLVLPVPLLDVCAAMLKGLPGRRQRPARRTVTDPASGLHVRVWLIFCGEKDIPAFSVQLDYRRPRGDRDRRLSPSALALYSRLSEREREVALRVRDGLTTLEIAAALNRSPLTIKTQLGGIFSKLGVTNRTQIAALLNR